MKQTGSICPSDIRQNCLLNVKLEILSVVMSLILR